LKILSFIYALGSEGDKVMRCVDVAAKGMAESMRSANAVYLANIKVKNYFLSRDDSEGGVKIVAEMIKDLDEWELQLRRIQHAARTCGKEVS
jgi:hypothetical protein